jgi:demethylmacrocin O-methyltransferase
LHRQQYASQRTTIADTMMNLIDLSIKNKTDKWIGHSYAKHYEHHLAKYKTKKIVFLEIGIGGYSNPDQGGQSLRVWSEWFEHPETVIIGADIHHKRLQFDDPRVKVRRGSQVDEEFLKELHSEFGDFDVILDDGSHIPEHVIKTFTVMYPMVKNGGTYIIEDTQTSYWSGPWSKDADYNTNNPTYSFFKNAPDWINYAEIPLPTKPSYLEKFTVGAHYYHNLIILDKDVNDEPSNILTSRLAPPGEAPNTRQIVLPASDKKTETLRLLAHIGNIGDVLNAEAASISCDKSTNQHIQGFTLECENSLLADRLEYRARLADGSWTNWVSPGSFVGTREKGLNLHGFTARLKANTDGRFSVVSLGSFAQTEGFVMAGNEEECCGPRAETPLCGMQIIVLSH